MIFCLNCRVNLKLSARQILWQYTVPVQRNNINQKWDAQLSHKSNYMKLQLLKHLILTHIPSTKQSSVPNSYFSYIQPKDLALTS